MDIKLDNKKAEEKDDDKDDKDDKDDDNDIKQDIRIQRLENYHNSNLIAKYVKHGVLPH